MNTPDAPQSADTLLILELQVARRADEIARTDCRNEADPFACWNRAEQEILGNANTVVRQDQSSKIPRGTNPSQR